MEVEEGFWFWKEKRVGLEWDFVERTRLVLCWSWCWWLVLSFEASVMGVMGLIQRWRDRVRREETERGRCLIIFAGKKKRKKKKVSWWVRIGWRKTHLLRQLLTQFILFKY